MVRVLHLLGRTPDFQTERGAGALAQLGGADFSISTETIGAGGNYRNAFFAVLGLRRESIHPPDIVHAWDLSALIASAAAGRGKIIYSPTACPDRHASPWLSAATNLHDVHVVCSSAAQQRAFLERGVVPARCRLILPGVDTVRLKPRRDAMLRAALGFGDGDCVIIAPGETTRLAAHRDVVWAASILHVLDPRYRMLLWGRGDQTRSCMRMSAKMSQPGLLTVAEQRLGRCVEFEELVSAADAVLHAPIGPMPTLPLAICMAGGVPIVAAKTPAIEEFLKDDVNSMMVPRRSSRLLAQRLIELRGDRAIESRITENARSEACGLFPPNRFIAHYRNLYREVAAGQK